MYTKDIVKMQIKQRITPIKLLDKPDDSSVLRVELLKLAIVSLLMLPLSKIDKKSILEANAMPKVDIIIAKACHFPNGSLRMIRAKMKTKTGTESIKMVALARGMYCKAK